MRPASASLTDGSIVRALMRLSIPIVLSNLLQTAYQITDSFWVGRLSAEAVAAVSLSFPISFLLIAIGGGLPVAGTVLIAQYKGRGDAKAMNHVAAQTLLMVVAVSLLLTAAGYALSAPIVEFMGAEPAVIPLAARYLEITFLGFLFVFGFFVFESLMRGLGEATMPMLIVLLTVLLNFALDPLFIFGWGPVPAMGASGAAMATLCTQAIATVIGFALLLQGKYGIHLRWADFRPDPAFLKRAFFIGLPSSIEQSTRALGFTVMTMLVASFGTVVLAAYGIGIRILTLAIIPALGFSIAASALVGQNIGAGKVDRASETNRVACVMAFAALTALGLLLFLLAEPLALFFMPEGGEAIGQSVDFTRITALSFGLIGVQMVLSGTLRGAGDTTAAMVITLVTQWLIQLPLAYALSFTLDWGTAGIWWSFTISNLLGAAITWIWFLRSDWKKRTLLGDEALQATVADEARIDEGVSA